MEQHIDIIAREPRPRTWSVLGLLALTALTFSYLGSYAITNALVAENVISPWPAGSDPRPRRLLIGFCVLMLIFMVLAEVFRQISKSDFRAIDAMANAEEEPAA
jgi:hypothetical protein